MASFYIHDCVHSIRVACCNWIDTFTSESKPTEPNVNQNGLCNLLICKALKYDGKSPTYCSRLKTVSPETDLLYVWSSCCLRILHTVLTSKPRDPAIAFFASLSLNRLWISCHKSPLIMVSPPDVIIGSKYTSVPLIL